MLLYPRDIFEKVEFNKIISLLKSECFGEPAIRYFESLEVYSDKAIVIRLLDEVDEWKKVFERGERIPIGSYDGVEEFIPLLKKEGYVLDVESIQQIHRILHLMQDMINYFKKTPDKAMLTNLLEIVSPIQIDPRLTTEIDRVFDETGEVRPNASPALSKISKSIQGKERELDKVFRQELVFYKEKGYLVENLESLRNGRRVLTVATEHKRKVDGIIHDESATGKTVYIEPERSMAINNELHNLYSERRVEIYKIIRELCQFLRPYADTIWQAEQITVKMDTVHAKARLAIKLKASRPEIINKPRLHFREAYNPILFLKFEHSDQKVVPFNLELHGQNRLLVLSGPNAGGKSVTLKTVGLLQIMIQCGMLVTADENSKFGIYNKFFVDIGDQQSMEDDLSTYSSHLTNMNHMVSEADDRTLVLIDEFGTGTDPKIGGAIAEAILSDINHKKVTGVITTHYSNLKYFAFKTPGILNGSMEFDKMKLSPTYVLHVGKPGSSFAFEIAEKIGLPKRIIKYAQHKTGKNEKAIDELLVDLQTERKEVEDKMTILLDKEERLEKLIKNYDQLHSELEFRRKKLKLDQKEIQAYKADEMTRELEKLVREIKREKNIEKAQEVLKQQKQEKQEKVQEVIAIKEEVYDQTKVPMDKLVIGSYVRMRNGDSIGKLVSLEKDKAQVQMGFLTVWIPIRELLPAAEPLEVQRQRSVNTSGVLKDSHFQSNIDLRGYRKEDALHFLQEFIEKAIINNAYELKIIHGVGNGILKKSVHSKLREYKDCREIWHPEENLGGEGVTMVRL